MALKNKLDNIEARDFRLFPKGALPSSDLEDGQMNIINGTLCIYDDTRAKWLSVQRQTLIFGRDDLTEDQYINYCVGNMASNLSGFRLVQDACITSMTAQSSVADSCTIGIRKNDILADSIPFSMSGVNGINDNTVNFDFYVGDYLQCYVDYTGSGSGMANLVVMLEIAWRL